MSGETLGLILGLSIGVVIGVALAVASFFCFTCRRKRAQIEKSSSRRDANIPIRVNGADSCTILSDSSLGTESPRSTLPNGMLLWLGGFKKANFVPASGIVNYSYKDLQKATYNFTTLIGQGAYGPVYKAQMMSGESVAVKVLATDSKQGEKEFQTEVMLLARLHHRNLVNLVGYCAEKNQHMLIYVYMIRGSLASHLYDEKLGALKWELRVQIALDVARGLEYLHDGAIPPVIHRDIKSSNILLDQCMRARVADFGLSREEMVSTQVSNIRGTFGYLDPEYISTRTFTKKSDVYSYGVLLFELIAARNPQQGLMEYVELAAMNTEGKVGWEEIVDPRLDGKFDVEELNEMATLAHKCVNRVARRRPSMRDIVLVLSRILKSRHSKRRLNDSSTRRGDEIKSKEQPHSIVAKLKRWERKECKPNSLPVIHKMHVKLGDTIRVISGRDKGKVGEVTSIIKHNSSIVVKDVNLKTKHVKSKEEGEQGQIIKVIFSLRLHYIVHHPIVELTEIDDVIEHFYDYIPQLFYTTPTFVLHSTVTSLNFSIHYKQPDEKVELKLCFSCCTTKFRHVNGRLGYNVRRNQNSGIEAPIHSSNVMLYSKEQNVVSRVGHKTLENGKRVRYLIKTGEVIDSPENWKRVVKEKEKSTELAAAS